VGSGYVFSPSGYLLNRRHPREKACVGTGYLSGYLDLLRQRDLAGILKGNAEHFSRHEQREELPMDLRLAVAELLERAERGESVDRVGASAEHTLEIRRAS
jgi:hypothetical protein